MLAHRGALWILNQYMMVASSEPSSVHGTPVAEVEEFSSKHTGENFLKRVRVVLHCESLPPYLLALCSFWSGRFAGWNVKLSHLWQKYLQRASSWYPLTFWCKICFTFLKRHSAAAFILIRGRDWECLCKIGLVFTYDGFSHAEKKIAQFDKNRAFHLPHMQSMHVNRHDTANWTFRHSRRLVDMVAYRTQDKEAVLKLKCGVICWLTHSTS